MNAYRIQFSFCCVVFLFLLPGIQPVYGQSLSSQPPVAEFDTQTRELITRLANEPQAVIDEMRRVVSAPQPAISKPLAYYVLSQAYYTLVLGSEALTTAEQGLELVSETHSPFVYHALSLAKANALDLLGRAEEGLPLSKAAESWAEQNQHNYLQVASTSTTGVLLLTLGKYDIALDKFQRAYVMAQQAQSNVSPGHIASLLALVYEYRGEDQLAIPYFEESLNHYRQINDRFNLSNSLYGLGRALRNTGDIARGLEYLKASAELSVELEDAQGLAYTQKELAQTYLMQGQYTEAEALFTNALSTFEQSENPFMQFGCLTGLARISLHLEQWEKAESYLERASQLITGDSMQAHKIEHDRMQSELLYGQTHYQAAYDMLLKSYVAHEAFMKSQNSERLLALKTEFDVAQKDLENLRLQQQNAKQEQHILVTEQRNAYASVIAGLALVICMLLFVGYRKKLQLTRKLERLANHDALTGLYSRRRVIDALTQQLTLAERHNYAVSVAVADLDFFKQINDVYGHQVGDSVLTEFGDIAKQCFRQSDILGRLGGEEFLFIFVQTTKDEAKQQLERFRQQVSTISQRIAKPQLQVSVSIGLAQYERGMTSTTLIASADKALYQAKASGRDQIAM